MSESNEKQKEPRDNISKNLEEDFSFDYNDFSKPTSWTDGVGLSRIKKYPDGYASLYKIGLTDAELNKKSPFKNLWISVNYGEESMGGVTLEDGKDLSHPIGLDSRDEFIYDVDNNKFYRNEREITAKDIISIIEELHLRPTKKAAGFFLRIYLGFWRKFLPTIIKYVDIFLIKLLWLISGERINEDIILRLIRHGDKGRKEFAERSIANVKFDETKMMDFFGYKAKRWSVVFYCVLNLIIYSLFFWKNVRYTWIVDLMRNNFLAICYAVVSFAIIESLIPKFLRWAIKKVTPQALGHISFMRLNLHLKKHH